MYVIIAIVFVVFVSYLIASVRRGKQSIAEEEFVALRRPSLPTIHF